MGLQCLTRVEGEQLVRKTFFPAKDNQPAFRTQYSTAIKGASESGSVRRLKTCKSPHFRRPSALCPADMDWTNNLAFS